MLEIRPQEIHLWIVQEKDVAPDLYDQYLPLLSEREMLRYHRLQQASDKKQFVLTQILARVVLAKYLDNEKPADIKFERGPFGKPYLPGAGQPQFNLTNSHGMMVLAITCNREIGIDVEYVNRDAACLKLARRYFTQAEAATFENLADETLKQHFFDYWTLKEAWLKAFGTGLRTPLNRFSLALGKEDVQVAFSPELQEKPQDWSFWQFDVNAGFRLSLSVRDAPGTPYTFSVQEGVPLQEFTECILQHKRGLIC